MTERSTAAPIQELKQKRITRQTELILEALMSDPTAEWSGSQIAPRARLKSGTLYPALARMERFGWLTWRWEDIEDAAAKKRPRRRFYKLTGEGERAALDIAKDAALRQARRDRNRRIKPAPRGVTA
jgi:PadR family transcriptional regulator, regulatory protein PadR